MKRISYMTAMLNITKTGTVRISVRVTLEKDVGEKTQTRMLRDCLRPYIALTLPDSAAALS